jgi:NADH-quinone oxidoreductase subunit E
LSAPSGKAGTDSRSPGRIKRFEHGSRVPGWDDSVDLGKPPAEVPEPATTPVPDELRKTIEEFMARYPDRHSAVIPALHAAQAVHGWCSPEAMDQVAAVMRVTPAFVSSIAGFYDMFDTERVGRHRVYVCTNISCSLNGADELFLELVESTAGDDDFTVRQFECLGACDIGPMASVDGVYIGPLETLDVPQIIDDVKAGRPVLEAKQLARRRVADPGANE